MSEIVALLKLAWNNCRHDVFSAIRLWLGGMIGLATLIVFWALNYQNNFKPLITQFTPIEGVYTTSDALLSATYFGFFNTVFTLTFILIIVLLFEYALSFTIVCYHYDNCSWVTPNLIRKTISSMWNEYLDACNRNKAKVAEENKESKEAMRKEISLIKKPDEL